VDVWAKWARRPVPDPCPNVRERGRRAMRIRSAACATHLA
jgi:hypothetical protein